MKRLCQGVEVGRPSFYAWIAGADARAQRQADDDALAERIKRVHHADRAYGAPRITAELNDPASPDNAPAVGDAPSADVPAGDRDRSPGQGRLLEPVNHKRVARVMRERRIAGLRLRRKVRTTVPDPDLTPVADLLKRAFTATAPNLRYVGDITYLPFDGGNLYLATVIDCYSRRLVGWSIAEHMRTDLVSDALRAAAQQRSSLRGAVFHSDHGAIRREELRPALPRARRGPLDGRCRHQRRQRPGRVVQRCPQAGDPARRRALGHRPAGPAGGVHLDHPLQHPP